MDTEIPDILSDSSSDATVIVQYNDSHDTQESCPKKSELDHLFDKYLGELPSNEGVPPNQHEITACTSNSEIIFLKSSNQTSATSYYSSDKLSSHDVLPSYNSTTSNKAADDTSGISAENKSLLTVPCNEIPVYDLTELSDTDLPSCSQTKRSCINNSPTKKWKKIATNLSENVSENKLEFLQNNRIPVNDSIEDSDIDVPSCSQSKTLNQFDVMKNSLEKESFSSDGENNLLPSYFNKKYSNNSKKVEKTVIARNRMEERKQKREEERKNKVLKDSLAAHYKNLKPENCLKFIKAHIDPEITDKDYSEDIMNQLRNNGVSYVVESQIASSTILWTRKLDTHILDLNGELINASKGLKIEEVVQFIECIDLINHIYQQTFLTYIESLHSIFNGMKIILVIYGLEKYYKFQRNKKSQELGKEVYGKTFKSLKDQKIFDDMPVISRRIVEYALTEVQLLYKISNKMVETKQDIGLLVFQLTKSLAQLPYKLEKQKQLEQARWFMSEDNKNCIRVDKNGNGLSRLWKQMITKFPLASLETAEAISSIYPTPASLIKAYEAVSRAEEGERLLQDIPIRRAAGPITTTRKVGLALSKKLYYFFTSIDPNKLL